MILNPRRCLVGFIAFVLREFEDEKERDRELINMNNPALDRGSHGLRAIGGVEFAEDICYMRFNCALGDAEFVADFFVAHAFRDFLQD
jgi:hypothetical protein